MGSFLFGRRGSFTEEPFLRKSWRAYVAASSVLVWSLLLKVPKYPSTLAAVMLCLAIASLVASHYRAGHQIKMRVLNGPLRDLIIGERSSISSL